MREMEVRGECFALAEGDLKRSLGHCDTSYGVTTTRTLVSRSGSTITIHRRCACMVSCRQRKSPGTRLLPPEHLQTAAEEYVRSVPMRVTCAGTRRHSMNKLFFAAAICAALAIATFKAQ